MAEKEATVYIVDVGHSMGKCRGGRTISDLDWMMLYVWDRITTTVSTGRKTATVGVVGLRTDGEDAAFSISGTRFNVSTGSSNPLWEKHEEESYAHLSVFQEIGQMLMPDIRKLRDLVKPSNTNQGDDMIVRYCKRLKYKRKIVLVTDGRSTTDSDGIDSIVSKIKEEGIELVILGVDFDDPDYGFKEEDKDPFKTKNESVLKILADDADGAYGTLAQAVEEMTTPRIKVVRGIPSFRGDLRLGDPSQYSTGLTIQVERYYRTYVARPPAASAFALSIAPPKGQSTAESSVTLQNGDSTVETASASNNLSGVRNARSYQVIDENAPGGKKEVERDDLAKGYEYGRTAVHISESDEVITKLDTTAALEFIGFIQSENYERYMNMSTSNVIIAQKINDKAILALSSMIHALFELEYYAIGRLVTKDGKPPLMVLLAPLIEPDFECLLEVQLPFAEDTRSYRFPPLDKIVTVSGKVVKEHRNLPSDDLLETMGKYVENMDLSEFDENGDPFQSLALEDCYSPLVHRIDQAIRWRAVHPTKPLPPVPKVLEKLSHWPEELVKKSHDSLRDLISISAVKKVPPKAKGRKRRREADKPLSGLNVDDLLRGEKRLKISPENPIPEFKQTLANTEDISAISDAVKQMSAIIEDQIRQSLGDINYDRAIEGIGTMREELIAYEEPGLYNDFIRGLKEKLLDDKLGGDRREMWWLIRKSRLGLIDQKALDISDITEEQAREFLSSRPTTV
ncbi:Ku70/Ku80 beta-barrel domain containing protein [Coccidioides posadasii C735 delta SOWgp]|uniref:ATP-dependent DNA helicase II subunit 2 n=1 Tax=Coccidioides posadasii (strain C735) TaxID=222929 RepID=C5PFJ2_COCP7|nr:Ku70/Ku80 beta-barrel domain containing protein [Coccidioides posadasii C735 delta SOWgp]EER23320.1 Ku70/Ku80 beta-barrel domain containing protein [Coccidioides posadasii C735 delta SOWgp]|eukprot:XP_003065465.1 Ku70/Ku80 beta-barrel domain containing protein [Coccidioides posadasii C735 delta SOWgp]